ncbi:MAG TPA: HEAT repeat domain-containing protein, partial [Pirellulaceae bacterium]|nr:HEAT repeat domain-containing protein [Pirellulaceae bacterium]
MASSRRTRLLQAIALFLTGPWLLSDIQLAWGQQATPASSKSTIRRFIKEIQSRDRNELRRAYTTLRQIGPNDEDGVPLILEALTTSDNNARSHLKSALVRIGPAAAPYLVEAVDRSETLIVRLTAITALGEIHASPTSAIPCLVRTLSDEAAEVRRASIVSIQRFGKASEEAIPALAAIVTEDSDDQVRIAAVIALGHLHLKPDTSVPCLVRALSDRSPVVRSASVVALAQFGSDARPAVDALRRAVDDEDKSVQMESLKTIATLGPTAAEAIPTLLKAMLDEDPQKSRQAALGVRRIGITSEEVVDSLLTATEDESPHVRCNAVWVLAASGDSTQRVVSRLIELLKDEDESVVRTTLLTLGKLGPDAKRAVVALIEAAKSDNRVVQALAEQAFRQVAPDRALEFLGKPFDAVQARLDDIKSHRVGAHDWPQLGGSRFRNNTPAGTNIPTTWNIGKFDRRTGEWISDDAVNIKWVARLGSQSYGNPVVANGKIYVGTNNGASHLKRYPSNVDLGCLLCFRESDGKFLWQYSSEKLPTGRVHDWPLQGIC